MIELSCNIFSLHLFIIYFSVVHIRNTGLSSEFIGDGLIHAHSLSFNVNHRNIVLRRNALVLTRRVIVIVIHGSVRGWLLGDIKVADEVAQQHENHVGTAARVENPVSDLSCRIKSA